MVLETLISPRKAEREPWEMFFIGLIYATVAIFISLWVFEQYASLVMVFFTVFASIHVIHGAMVMEEKRDLAVNKESLLLKGHARALAFFMFLFLGFIVAYSIWYLILPADTVNNLFSVQTLTINDVNSRVTGGSVSGTILGKIFFNNIKVMLIALFFSFFYGAGAIFVLSWNASVIAAAMGNFFRVNVMNNHAVVAYTNSLLRYMVHGIPEILAYFVAGLAGGIISIAIARHDVRSPHFKMVLMDSIDLIFIAVFLLIIAALLEVFVTPMLF